jgi:hypothetical protein
VIFQLLYQKYIGQRKWAKQHFGDYLKNQDDDTELQTNHKSLLDVLFDLEITDISDFSFYNLELRNCVDKNWAIDSEILPQWMLDWVYVAQDKRFDFISKLGYNGTDSPIVKLRKAAISENYEENTVVRYFEEAKQNVQVVLNTIKWLSNYSTEKITNNIAIIKQINDFVTFKSISINAVTIPIIESINLNGQRTY